MKDLKWFLLATLALNLTPGPDMMLVGARALARGVRAGALSALGIACGCAVHALAAALGLAGLLAESPLAFEVLRHGGAVYLVYLGIRTLRERDRAPAEAVENRETLGGMFTQGMITNLLNPKIGIFFFAFLPQFVEPGAPDPFLRVLLLGGLFNLSGTLVNLAVALAAGLAGERIGRPAGRAAGLRRVGGIVLIALGLGVALR